MRRTRRRGFALRHKWRWLAQGGTGALHIVDPLTYVHYVVTVQR